MPMTSKTKNMPEFVTKLSPTSSKGFGDHVAVGKQSMLDQRIDSEHTGVEKTEDVTLQAIGEQLNI